MKKILAWILVLALGILPTLAMAETEPGALLGERMTQASDAGRQFTYKLRAEMGETMKMALVGDPDQFALIEKVLKETEIEARFAQVGDTVELQLALIVSGESVVSGKLYVVEDGLAMVTSLLPGKTLLVPSTKLLEMFEGMQVSGQMDMEVWTELAAVIEDYSAQIQAYFESQPDVAQVIEEPTAATQTRDASASHAIVTFTAEQIKELALLADKAIYQNPRFHSFLAQITSEDVEVVAEECAEFTQAIEALKTVEGQMTVAAYENEDDLVGLDLKLEQIFEQAPMEMEATYDRLTKGTQVSHTVRGTGTSKEDDSAMSFVFSSMQDRPNANTKNNEVHFSGESLLAGEPFGNMKLDFAKTTQLNGAIETTNATLAVSAESKDMGEEETPRMSIGGFGSMKMTVDSKTEALAGDDFISRTTADFALMGMSMFKLEWTLSSGEYVPEDLSGNTVVDITAMSDEEDDELTAELQTNLNILQYKLMMFAMPEAAN